MQTVSIGIIGCGQIAKNHLKRYAGIEGVRVAAACDIDRDELTRVADQYDIDFRTADFRELLGKEDILAVDVCLHNNYHAPATIAALQAGKHVYCEKPIAGSYADGLAMVQAAEKADRMLHIQLSTLYTKETKSALRLIEAGALGRLYHGRSNGYRRRGRPYVDGYGTPTFVQKRNSAGGALFDMGIYHIAQMLYLLGGPQARRVSGKIYQETAMDERRARESGYDVEELGMGFVRFDKDLTMDIQEAWAIHSDPFPGSLVAGTEGGVRLSPFGFFSHTADLAGSTTFDLDSEDFRLHALVDNYDAYDSSQHHWVAVLQDRVPLLPTASLALETMLIQEGIYLSDRLNREVTRDEIVKDSQSTAVTL